MQISEEDETKATSRIMKTLSFSSSTSSSYEASDEEAESSSDEEAESSSDEAMEVFMQLFFFRIWFQILIFI